MYRDLRELIAAGSLGTIGFIRFQFLWEFEEDRVLDNWRATLDGSGGSWVVKEFGAHLLDLLLWWTGAGAGLAGATLCTRRFPVETDDCAALLLTLESGAIGIVEVSAAMRGRTNSVEIQGSSDCIRAHDVWRGNGSVVSGTGEERRYHNDDELANAHWAQLKDFTAGGGGPALDGRRRARRLFGRCSRADRLPAIAARPGVERRTEESMSTVHKLRIADLTDPVLNDVQQEALEEAERTPFRSFASTVSFAAAVQANSVSTTSVPRTFGSVSSC